MQPTNGRGKGEEMNLKKIVATDADATTLLVRLMVGAIFLSEGIQKFLFAEELGAGRFTKIGLPYAEFLGPLVGSFEIICGVLVLIGLITRLASVPLITIIIVAIITTKIDVYLNDGFWEMLHGSRTDWSMLLGGIFLLLRGGGKWSFDRQLEERAFRSGASNSLRVLE